MNISIILFLFLFVTPIFGVRPEKQGKSQQNFDRSTTGTSNQYDTGSGSTTGGTSTGGQPQFWPNMQHQQDQPLPQNLQDHEENIENKEDKTISLERKIINKIKILASWIENKEKNEKDNEKYKYLYIMVEDNAKYSCCLCRKLQRNINTEKKLNVDKHILNKHKNFIDGNDDLSEEEKQRYKQELLARVDKYEQIINGYLNTETIKYDGCYMIYGGHSYIQNDKKTSYYKCSIEKSCKGFGKILDNVFLPSTKTHTCDPKSSLEVIRKQINEAIPGDNQCGHFYENQGDEVAQEYINQESAQVPYASGCFQTGASGLTHPSHDQDVGIYQDNEALNKWQLHQEQYPPYFGITNTSELYLANQQALKEAYAPGHLAGVPAVKIHEGQSEEHAPTQTLELDLQDFDKKDKGKAKAKKTRKNSSYFNL